MLEFVNPFSGKVPDRKLTHEELIRAIRLNTAAEVKGTGVTANVILPSVIDTPPNRASMPKADPGKWVPPERIDATMRFLCSDAAASINGARLPVYGAV